MPGPASAKPSVNRRWLGALAALGGVETSGQTFPDIIDDLAELQGERPALLSDRDCLSFAELSARSNRYSRWLLSTGLPSGGVVALLMPNRPDYLAAWIGITRVGCTVALLNTGLTGPAMAHAITSARPAHIVVAGDCSEALAGALPHLAAPIRTWSCETELGPVLDEFSGSPLTADERRAATLSDPALLIYTSGTTGYPKAAWVSHRRIVTWCRWFGGLARITSADRMYDCLPLFHSVGGVVAPGCVLAAGGSVVIAERFSATRFWDEVHRWDCTLFQYIGELCRYLVNAAPPVGPAPPHRLRLALGNGLRADVWTAFEQRFAVPEIIEFYAATEGSFSLVNVEGKAGSLGRIPPILEHRFPVAIVAFDAEAGCPARGPDGFCRRLGPDEVGEAIGRVDASEGSGRFEGYTNQDESDAKVLRDVFAPGDRWFRTGDLMRRDAAGFFFFIDRVGDTFRWKGENVSTLDVADVLAGVPGIVEATAYGVNVPGHDGRAGMVAIVADGDFSLRSLEDHVDGQLPTYARPVFLRLCSRIAATATFKQQKALLATDGFDPGAVLDPLFVRDAASGRYVGLDAARFSRIASGEARL